MDAQDRHKQETPQQPASPATPPSEKPDTFELSSPKLSREAHSIHKLALLYQDQHNYEEAERLYQKVLVLLKPAAEPNDPELAGVLNNLGRLYFEQKRYKEAERLIRNSLAMVEARFGKEHPKVARRLANLAELAYAIGNPAEADFLYQRALTIEERELGVRDPRTVKTARAYVAMLKNLESLARAEAIAACFFVLRRAHDRRAAAERRVAARSFSGWPRTEPERRYRRDRRSALGRRAS